jgi:predicted TPR repeat methyltransferase
MPAFTTFDRRGYRSVGAREGYGLWAATYEQTIKHDMDLRLVAEVRSVHWSAIRRTVDLGCGTGRTGAWLASRGVREIHGVDLTPEMIERARARSVFGSCASRM